jgi:hypothetical protein
MKPASGSPQFKIQCSTDNGATYDTTTNDYPGYSVASGTITNNTTATLSPNTTLSTANFTGITLNILGYGLTGVPKLITGTMEQGTFTFQNFQTAFRPTNPITNLQLILASSTFASGSYIVYAR